MNGKNQMTAKKAIIWIIISGILTGLSIYYMWYWLIWIALVPFFYLLPANSFKQSLVYGLVFGIIETGILLFLMVSGPQWFNQHKPSVNTPYIYIGIIYFTIFPVLIALALTWLGKKRRSSSQLVLAISAAIIWALFEWLIIGVFKDSGWLKFTIGFSQIKLINDDYIVYGYSQGVASFIIVWVNYLLSRAILLNNLKMAFTGIFTIEIFYFLGVLLAT